VVGRGMDVRRLCVGHGDVVHRAGLDVGQGPM
jgi:hypothetical protein